MVQWLKDNTTTLKSILAVLLYIAGVITTFGILYFAVGI